MTEEQDSVTVVIRDDEVCRLGAALDTDTAMTLIAVASEDPSCWEDVLGYWPRYRTPAVCEFIDSLPIAPVDLDAALSATNESDVWVLIDLAQKRILTGRTFQPVGRDAASSQSPGADCAEARPRRGRPRGPAGRSGR